MYQIEVVAETDGDVEYYHQESIEDVGKWIERHTAYDRLSISVRWK